jgi:hypothetical protein
MRSAGGSFAPDSSTFITLKKKKGKNEREREREREREIRKRETSREYH